jgi:hypothetical protein
VREFDKPIGKVWRLLRLQRFLGVFVWTLGAMLLVAAGVIVAEKFIAQPVPGQQYWPSLPFVLAGGIALVVALFVACVSGPSRVDAAIAIDRAFHLNDRLGTVLTLPADLLDSPAGVALLGDTRRHIDGLDLGSKFGLRIPKRAWIPVVPALLALGLLFLPELSSRKAQAEQKTKEADVKKVSEQAKLLNKRLAEARKELDKAKFAESEKLLAQIEKAAEKLEKAPPADKQKALVELNKLTDALKERQKQVGNSEQISRKLQQLKEMTSTGPADDFAKELAKGDFQKAANQLKDLQKKLMDGKMTADEKKQLREQLGQMKDQLQKMANLEERKKQLEQALKSGSMSKEQFDQQMSKLNDQAQDLKKLQKLAQQLAQAQQQMQQGDMQKAAEALGMSQQQLQQMAQELSEMESLDSALADIAAAKDGMTGGDGLNQLGNRLGDMPGMGQGNGNNQGNGLGRGRGRGDRPITEDDTATYKARVRQQVGQGKAILEGFGPPGAQTVGESLVEVQGDLETSTGVAAEALTNQKVPKHVRKHVQSYIDEFRRDGGSQP